MQFFTSSRLLRLPPRQPTGNSDALDSTFGSILFEFNSRNVMEIWKGVQGRISMKHAGIGPLTRVPTLDSESADQPVPNRAKGLAAPLVLAHRTTATALPAHARSSALSWCRCDRRCFCTTSPETSTFRRCLCTRACHYEFIYINRHVQD